MTNNEKLQLWQAGLLGDLDESQVAYNTPDYLNDDAANSSLLDTLVDNGLRLTSFYLVEPMVIFRQEGRTMTDWCWCYENPKEAAQLIDDLSKDIESLRVINSTGQHKHISELEAKFNRCNTERQTAVKEAEYNKRMWEGATNLVAQLTTDRNEWKDQHYRLLDTISEWKEKCEKMENAHRKIWKQILEPAHLYEIATRMQKISGDALGI